MIDNDAPAEGSLFTPLDPAKKEIRLLQVAPYDSDVLSICSCTLTKASLSQDAPPKFNAFSYEWNYNIQIPEYDIKATVLVDGYPVQVTKNLAALLTRFRNIRQTIPDFEAFQLPLWIDALCIDQENPEERNNQVALMGAIFRGAEATLMYLGEGDDDSDYAMEMIGSVGSKIIGSMREGDLMAWVKPEEQPELWRRDGEEDSGSLNRFWHNIGGLMNRSYWKRAWIVQEILLQPNVIIFCGKMITHYHQLNAVFHWLRNIQGKPCPPGIDVNLWLLLSSRVGWYSMGLNNFIMRRSFKDPGGVGGTELSELDRHLRWKTWALNTINQQATDPRDNLYSVLGLVGDDVLKPDYSRSVETVFYDFATTNICLEGSIGILTYAGHWELPSSRVAGVDSPPANLFVPSWVPNWDQISKMYSFTWLFSQDHRADKGWESVLVVNQDVPWSIRGNTLVAPGIFVDAVSWSTVCDINDGTWLSFCAGRLDAHASQPYPSGIPIMQALARLVLRDQAFPDRKPLEPTLDVATLVSKVYPGLAATLRSPSASEGKDSVKDALQMLGISSYEDMLAKLAGRPFKSMVPELAPLLPLINQMAAGAKAPDTPDGPWPSMWADAANFGRSVSAGMPQYAAFVTKRGYVGWARKGLREGDEVCVLPACPAPVLLRDVGGRSIHLGSCYVEGLMHGEAMSCVREGSAQLRTFHIV